MLSKTKSASGGKLHILIDARLYGPKHTGIGRYVKNLLLALTKLPDFTYYQWSLIVYQNQLSEIKADLGQSFTYIPTTIRHYSLSEQILLPFLLYKIHPHLVHFTHFNKPLLYFGRSVVTIHDLIKHLSTGPDTTTRTIWLYWLKYLAYRFLTFITIHSNFLIVPSNYWRDYILRTYHISPSKIITTHEALDPNFKISTRKPKKLPLPYLIYTGNLYPHKNINIILSALKELPHLKLKIICARSVFSQRIKKLVSKFHLQHQVRFLGYVQDSHFAPIYASALALVHPSFYEGFSLTGLEAMGLNCPVISSNSSCLPEVYGNSVLYFDPHSVRELISRVHQLQSNPALRLSLIKKGKTLLKKYSWTKTASQTFDVYQQCLK